MKIREALPSDLEEVLRVERLAFGEDEEADLTKALLEDPSAKPTLSLLAFDEKDKAVGHLLFTNAHIEGNQHIKVAILAPLAVVPESQKQGIGGNLVRHGLKQLKEDGVELVFVLGHPEYYPRHGFQPAGAFGFEGTYPIAEKNAAAWMVQALQEPSAIIGEVKGRVVCADALNKLKFWVEPSDEEGM